MHVNNFFAFRSIFRRSEQMNEQTNIHTSYPNHTHMGLVFAFFLSSYLFLLMLWHTVLQSWMHKPKERKWKWKLQLQLQFPFDKQHPIIMAMLISITITITIHNLNGKFILFPSLSPIFPFFSHISPVHFSSCLYSFSFCHFSLWSETSFDQNRWNCWCFVNMACLSHCLSLSYDLMLFSSKINCILYINSVLFACFQRCCCCCCCCSSAHLKGSNAYDYTLTLWMNNKLAEYCMNRVIIWKRQNELKLSVWRRGGRVEKNALKNRGTCILQSKHEQQQKRSKKLLKS